MYLVVGRSDALLLIGGGHVGVGGACVYLCVCVHVCVCVCVCVCLVCLCVGGNPGESPPLKGNRCRFTYVEGPLPLMRLAGWGLSSQPLEGAYLINACS